MINIKKVFFERSINYFFFRLRDEEDELDDLLEDDLFEEEDLETDEDELRLDLDEEDELLLDLEKDDEL